MVVKYVSALGKVLPLLVIFSRALVQQQWFLNEADEDFMGWRFTYSPNRWINDYTALCWLRDRFIPLTQPTLPN